MPKPKLIVIGNGMVGHKLIEVLIQEGATNHYDILVFGEEQRIAYDRVHLSSYFEGKTAEDLSLASPDYYQEHGIQLFTGERILQLDREQALIISDKRSLHYDSLVLATGSYPFVPAIKGNDAAGCFVYRTIDDLEAIAAYAKHCTRGTVIGGGLLGLEAANALKNLGLKTSIVEFAPHLMPRQVDELGGTILRQRIENLGLEVYTSKQSREIVLKAGRVCGIDFADDSQLASEMIVFSAGIRPRDDLGKEAGLDIGTRGGIVIDKYCCTSDSKIYAIGECAAYENQCFGLVAPGYEMARVVAEQLCLVANPKQFTGADMSTKLKLLGVELASFGQIQADAHTSKEISLLDAHAGTYKKIILDAAGQHILGAVFVGDASQYDMLLQIKQNKLALPPHPEDLILPSRDTDVSPVFGLDSLPDTAKICTCENVSKGQLNSAIATNGFTHINEVKACTGAGTGCGSCVNNIKKLLQQHLEREGIAVVNHLCEHFPYSRQELFHIVRVNSIKNFAELLERYGKGLGCEICKPVVASILASTWNEYILEGDKASLQDTNDYFLANIQRDGTYSIIPRIPGGEITPDRLITLGEIAKDFNLYLKLTGGQRIDMLGAHLDQLPIIWKRLTDAGFESGHGYGKALRTVKSCVGSTWCRYGQQDSVSLAIRLENRYKGLRAPHKLKSACSGCARECAEAQSKDFGLIATERGYNLYVGGNGGMRPRHAQLLAEDLDEEEVIKYLDRYLMFYIRTADKLQRTADWMEGLEGGVNYLRHVIIEDALGLGAELEQEMAQLVTAYECEWKRTLGDEERMKRFRYFVDSDERDPNVIFVEQRGQKRPVYPEERTRLS